MLDQVKLMAESGGRISLFHIFIVSLSLLLTLSAWQFSKQQVDSRSMDHFEEERDHVVALISDRMTKYEDALWAGVAAVGTHGGSIAYADWRTFAQNLRIERRYPGINGIGIIHFHTAQSLDGYLADQRQTRPDFRVFPQHDQTFVYADHIY